MVRYLRGRMNIHYGFFDVRYSTATSRKSIEVISSMCEYFVGYNKKQSASELSAPFSYIVVTCRFFTEYVVSVFVSV
jgi:hypothetical protein